MVTVNVVLCLKIKSSSEILNVLDNLPLSIIIRNKYHLLEYGFYLQSLLS